mmetsp:Transcript_20456/g.57629  ORF Transcript_20456/g.57629 Transcript_20456/m.57629 type:complete len:309 (+) Transcript_20456:1722-2648(+)
MGGRRVQGVRRGAGAGQGLQGDRAGTRGGGREARGGTGHAGAPCGHVQRQLARLQQPPGLPGGAASEPAPCVPERARAAADHELVRPAASDEAPGALLPHAEQCRRGPGRGGHGQPVGALQPAPGGHLQLPGGARLCRRVVRQGRASQGERGGPRGAGGGQRIRAERRREGASRAAAPGGGARRPPHDAGLGAVARRRGRPRHPAFRAPLGRALLAALSRAPPAGGPRHSSGAPEAEQEQAGHFAAVQAQQGERAEPAVGSGPRGGREGHYGRPLPVAARPLQGGQLHGGDRVESAPARAAPIAGGRR